MKLKFRTICFVGMALLTLPVHAQVSATFVRQWGGSGSGNGQFAGTHACGVSPLMRVYVADEANHRIQYFSMSGAYLGKWGAWGQGTNEIVNPVCIAFQPDGTVYVVERDNNRIHYFTPDGAHLGMWGSSGSANGQFSSPAAAAFAPDGTLFVADRFNHRVQHFTANGVFLGAFGTNGVADGQFREPFGITVSGSNVVYVTDSQNWRVQFFTTNGVFLGKWGSSGSGDGQFGNTSIYNNGPAHIAIDARGYIYVADPNNNRIEVFSQSGAFLGKWGSYGTGNGGYYFPNCPAVAPGWQVYIGDEGNSLIQQMTVLTGSDTNARIRSVSTDTSVVVRAEAIPGVTYGVKRSTNLVDWAALQSVVPTEGLFSVTDAVQNASAVFFRVVR